MVRLNNSTSDLALVTPEWQIPGINVCTTTRIGGVSKAPFDSLNLGLHVDDDVVAVKMNRDILAAALDLPSSPVWLRQCHGSDVFVANPQNSTQDKAFDAAVTRTPGTVIAVLTADCLPVVVADSSGTEVAVAHAGWRGLAEGVLQNTVKAMQNSPTALRAWLGPAIGPEQFEVGPDVLQEFERQQPSIAPADAFRPRQQQGKWLADLYELARRILLETGVSNVSGGQYCTLTDAERFYSYRRDGKYCGRQATLAWISQPA